jgi:hypothetical protein
LRNQSAGPAAQAAAVERFATEARVIFAEQISPVYEKSMTHVFAIMLLTGEARPTAASDGRARP